MYILNPNKFNTSIKIIKTNSICLLSRSLDQFYKKYFSIENKFLFCFVF